MIVQCILQCRTPPKIWVKNAPKVTMVTFGAFFTQIFGGVLHCRMHCTIMTAWEFNYILGAHKHIKKFSTKNDHV